MDDGAPGEDDLSDVEDLSRGGEHRRLVLEMTTSLGNQSFEHCQFSETNFKEHELVVSNPLGV